MATVGQVTANKIAALVIAILTAWQWRSEDSGWSAAMVVGIVAYVFWKIAIAAATGIYEGTLTRVQNWRRNGRDKEGRG